MQPRTFLLSGTDMARRIGMRGDVISGSRFVTLEPRALRWPCQRSDDAMNDATHSPDILPSPTSR